MTDEFRRKRKRERKLVFSRFILCVLLLNVVDITHKDGKLVQHLVIFFNK